MAGIGTPVPPEAVNNVTRLEICRPNALWLEESVIFIAILRIWTTFQHRRSPDIRVAVELAKNKFQVLYYLEKNNDNVLLLHAYNFLCAWHLWLTPTPVNYYRVMTLRSVFDGLIQSSTLSSFYILCTLGHTEPPYHQWFERQNFIRLYPESISINFG